MRSVAMAVGLAVLAGCGNETRRPSRATIVVRLGSAAVSTCAQIEVVVDGQVRRQTMMPTALSATAPSVANLDLTGLPTGSVRARGFAAGPAGPCALETQELATEGLRPGLIRLQLGPDRVTDGGADGGRDGGLDGGVDGGLDGGADAGVDGGADGGVDGGADGGLDGGRDGGVDAGPDGGVDAGPDGGVDAGPDAGADAGIDSDGDNSPSSLDCNDNDATIYPGAIEVCDDGKDNDCDRESDCEDQMACRNGTPCGLGYTCAPAPTCQGRVCVRASNCMSAGQCQQSCLDGGVCSVGPAPVATSCNDGDSCTLNDQCNSVGMCTGSARLCPPPPNADGGCYAGVRCVSGSCTPTYSPLGSSCNAPVCSVGTCLVDAGCDFSSVPARTPCDGGACNGVGQCIAKAFTYVPANVGEPSATGATLNAVALACSLVVDTTGPQAVVVGGTCLPVGQMLPSSIAIQTGGPEVMVLLLEGDLNLNSNSTIQFIGTRPVALLVRGDATIDGSLFVNSARGGARTGAGAIATMGCTGAAPGQTLSTSGGGGGGYGTDGGAGSTVGTSGNSGQVLSASGVAFGTPQISPLVGGCPGGAPTTGGFGSPVVGGRGGGALQLSVSGRLTVNGTLHAGGAGAVSSTGAAVGGPGGGSGGAILLEAIEVIFGNNAVVAANGGGGAAGTPTGPGVGATSDSVDGQPSASPADGGTANCAYNGGNGGVRGVPPGAGQIGLFSSGGCATIPGGGGGGAVGRIAIRAQRQCSGNPRVMSPVNWTNLPLAGCQF